MLKQAFEKMNRPAPVKPKVKFCRHGGQYLCRHPDKPNVSGVGITIAAAYRSWKSLNQG